MLGNMLSSAAKAVQTGVQAGAQIGANAVQAGTNAVNKLKCNNEQKAIHAEKEKYPNLSCTEICANRKKLDNCESSCVKMCEQPKK